MVLEVVSELSDEEYSLVKDVIQSCLSIKYTYEFLPSDTFCLLLWILCFYYWAQIPQTQKIKMKNWFNTKISFLPRKWNTLRYPCEASSDCQKAPDLTFCSCSKGSALPSEIWDWTMMPPSLARCRISIKRRRCLLPGYLSKNSCCWWNFHISPVSSLTVCQSIGTISRVRRAEWPSSHYVTALTGNALQLRVLNGRMCCHRLHQRTWCGWGGRSQSLTRISSKLRAIPKRQWIWLLVLFLVLVKSAFNL